ncbi:hypothetical protein [Streptomyces sp. NBC_01233]|uniref:hypothetical protein n=1 Tax=Streptomyces sp. NBC_01233 TaxID=2903787 RepID=UPI002E1660C0|nr:hypothetical protein OG332_22140 [Streptomyces sp. NBC_01233]
MIQGFRPPRWLACAALVAAALAPAASAYAGPFALASGSASRTSPASPTPSNDGYRELAGSAAGVGRERPGRPAGEPANPELVVAARPLPVRPQTRPTPPVPSPTPPPPVVAPSPPGRVTALGTEPNDRAADLAAHILPLGTGFALMGLGLGYLGVRLRRSI